jgi:hypothetical protein
MNEPIPSFEWMQKMALAASMPEPSEKFLKDLRLRLESRAGERRAAVRRTRRLAWAAACAGLVIAATCILAAGPANVAAALQEVLGYIPGFGVVRMTGLRMLAEPVVITRGGVTITLKSVIADSAQTAASYEVIGLKLPPMNPSVTPDPDACTAYPFLRFSNNQKISSTGGGGMATENSLSGSLQFPPLPDDVVDASLVFPCLSGALPGTGPENVDVPFHLVRHPTAPTVVPVQQIYTPSVESGSPVVQNSSGNKFQQQISLQIDSMAEVEDGFIIMGSVLTTSDKYFIDPFFPPGTLAITDSSGAEIPAEMAAVGNDDPSMPESQPAPAKWAYKVQGKYFRGPLTLALKYAAISPKDEITLNVDVGSHPRDGQMWTLDRPLDVLGSVAVVQSARYVVRDGAGTQGMQGLEFTVRLPKEIEGLQLNYGEPNPQPGPGGGFSVLGDGLKHGKDILRTGFLVTWPLAGNIGTAVNVIHVNGPWSVSWNPPSVDGAPSPTPVPQACLTNDSWEALQNSPRPPIPSDAVGRMLYFKGTNPGNVMEMILAGLEGAGAQPLKKGVMDGSLSQDGKWLAFVDPDGKLSVMNADTSKTVRLTQDAGIAHPIWSPDGQWLAFLVANPSGEPIRLFVIRPDGTGRREVGANANARDLAGWFPDPSSLLIMASDNDQVAGLFLKKVSLNSGIVTPELTGVAVQGAAISPDGEWIVYLHQEFGRNGPWLSLARRDGSDRRLLIRMDGRWSVANPVWSPDGQWLSVSVADTENFDQLFGVNIIIDPTTCQAVPLPGVEGMVSSWVR